MTVGELRKFLKQFPQDIPVILSRDPEGNGYSMLADGGLSLYDSEERPYYIEQIYLTHEELDAEIAKDKANNKQWGYSEEDRAPEGAVPAVVLWPI